jgi:hypothetical protein
LDTDQGKLLTIAYLFVQINFRYMTEMCPPAFITLIFQMIVGLLLQTMLAGIVVAKVLRPKKRKQVCF